MSAANVYLACGGSGIKTLKSLTIMLSQDPVFRHGFKNDVFYIAVDTDKAELKGLKDHVTSLIPEANERNVIAIQTSSDVKSLSPLVLDVLHRIKSLPEDEQLIANRRFTEHWWHNHDRPFTTDQRLSPQDGAGQCPPVSFFLAWRQLPEISAKMEALFSNIIKKRAGDLAADGKRHLPLENLNVHVIAGLAGGTGRGCWELLAFKLGEILRKQFGGQLNVKALLFDASVTKNVPANKKPPTALATKVNAITGISQISLWEEVLNNKQNLRQRLRKIDERFEELEDELIYRLPSLENPGDEDSDVLQVHAKPPTEEEKRVGHGAEPPASSVSLIFDANDRAVLDNSDDYYEMAGRALYAQMKFSMVSRSVINYKSFYNSIGGASIEVPASKIQEYLEANSRIAFLENLSAAYDWQPVYEKAMADLRPMPGFSGDDDDMTVYEKCVPGPELREDELSLWQKTVKRIFDGKANEWSGLKEDLVKGSNLDQLLEDLHGYAAVSDREVAEAVAATLGELPCGSGLGVLRPYLDDIFYCGQGKNSPNRNLQGVADFCRAFRDGLVQSLDALPDQVTFGQERTIETVFNETKGRSMLVGRRFEDDEIVKLGKGADQELLRNLYPTLRKAFADTLKVFFAATKSIGTNTDQILEVVREVKKDIEASLATKWDLKNKFEKCFDQAFCDPANPAEDLHHEDAKRFYQRVLKPALSREQVRAICTDSKSLRQRDAKTVEAIDRMLMGRATDEVFFNTAAGKDKIGFARELDRELKQAVTIRPEFVEEQFALEKSLQTLRDAWALHFREVAYDRDKLEKAKETFQSVFGRRPQEKMGEFDVGSTKELIKDMTASLASTTTAYWKLADAASSERSVFVFLPGLGDEFQKDEWEKYLSESMPKGVTPSVYSGERGECNPFAIVAFAVESTSKGLENLLSLNYWRETSVVRHLQRAEEKFGGNAIFNPILEDMNGSSFHDPVYVENELYARLRWRPWYEKKAATADQAEDDVVKALLYAFMQPVGEIGRFAESKGWKLPLLQFDEVGTLTTARNGLKWTNDDRVLETPGAIETGLTIGRKRGGLSGAKQWLTSEEGSSTLRHILEERTEFWAMLGSEGFDRKKKPYGEFCDELAKVFASLREGPGGHDKADKDLWNDLVRILQDRNSNLV